MRSTILLMLLGIASTSYGNHFQIRATFQDCKTFPGICKTEYGIGSAFSIGRSGDEVIIITAGHLFRPDRRKPNQILTNITINKIRVDRMVAWYDNDNTGLDVGILATKNFPSKSVVLADKLPKDREPLIVTHGDGTTAEGYYIANSSKSRTPYDRAYFKKVSKSLHGWNGWSGSKIENMKGEIVGVLVGEGVETGDIHFTNSINLIDFIKRNFKDYEFLVSVKEIPNRDLPPPPESYDDSNIRKGLQLTNEKLDAIEKGMAKKIIEAINSHPHPDIAIIAEGKTTAAYRGSKTKLDADFKSDLSSKFGNLLKVVTERNEKTAPAEDLILGVSSNPWVIGALGGTTGGTGALALVAAQAFLRYRKRKREGGSEGQQPTSFPQEEKREEQREFLKRETSEAEELIQLGRLEGRDPILDSFIGMSFQDEIKNDRSKPELGTEVKDYLASLSDRVMARVDQVAPVAAKQSYSDRSR